MASARKRLRAYPFLAYFEKENWQSYLRELTSLSYSILNSTNEGSITIKVDETNSRFLDKMVVNITEEIENYDFITIRAKPLYKLEEGKYRVIFDLFAVEKTFKGLYFQFRNINNALPNGQRINSLKGIYGHKFSEQQLLYNVLEAIFPINCTKFTGDELDKMKIIGAPDYYIRKGKNIMLFESKDFLISAENRSSFDFNIYEKEIAKSLYFEKKENGKIKDGAVRQLIKNIERVLLNDFLADKEYCYKRVYIYPIIITHDRQYDTPGLNSLVSHWFRNEVKVLDQKGYFTHHIKARNSQY